MEFQARMHFSSRFNYMLSITVAAERLLASCSAACAGADLIRQGVSPCPGLAWVRATPESRAVPQIEKSAGRLVSSCELPMHPLTDSY